MNEIPLLYKRITIPEELLAQTTYDGNRWVYGGDIRIGDLTGDGCADFALYRSLDDAHDGGGLKPCFLGAFTADGRTLWAIGTGGEQPSRPGPLAIHDLDGDGRAEVLCFFRDPDIAAPPDSMGNVWIQLCDGRTGAVERQVHPACFDEIQGQGANWVHQRLVVARLRDTSTPQDFVVKLGAHLLAFDDRLDLLWRYRIRWNTYGQCAAYVPAVGDMDGDGLDEVNGGYFLLDADGEPLWEKALAPHMDSVAIATWDKGRKRAICSGHGHVLDAEADVLVRLGPEAVPHGQEVRVARFLEDEPEPQMVIRNHGHEPAVILVDTAGQIRRRLQLNSSPNNTGMEPVYWRGQAAPALLYNGGRLWDLDRGESVALPHLPAPVGPSRMGWYHAIPADVCGDAREELVVYNPWGRSVYIYTPSPFDDNRYSGYKPGPRQYNPRLMD
jgi:hypothetical protein